MKKFPEQKSVYQTLRLFSTVHDYQRLPFPTPDTIKEYIASHFTWGISCILLAINSIISWLTPYCFANEDQEERANRV